MSSPSTRFMVMLMNRCIDSPRAKYLHLTERESQRLNRIAGWPVDYLMGKSIRVHKSRAKQ